MIGNEIYVAYAFAWHIFFTQCVCSQRSNIVPKIEFILNYFILHLVCVDTLSSFLPYNKKFNILLCLCMFSREKNYDLSNVASGKICTRIFSFVNFFLNMVLVYIS